jgi:hypothetical protein
MNAVVKTRHGEVRGSVADGVNAHYARLGRGSQPHRDRQPRSRARDANHHHANYRLSLAASALAAAVDASRRSFNGYSRLTGIFR